MDVERPKPLGEEVHRRLDVYNDSKYPSGNRTSKDFFKRLNHNK